MALRFDPQQRDPAGQNVPQQNPGAAPRKLALVAGIIALTAGAGAVFFLVQSGPGNPREGRDPYFPEGTELTPVEEKLLGMWGLTLEDRDFKAPFYGVAFVTKTPEGRINVAGYDRPVSRPEGKHSNTNRFTSTWSIFAPDGMLHFDLQFTGGGDRTLNCQVHPTDANQLEGLCLLVEPPVDDQGQPYPTRWNVRLRLEESGVPTPTN